MIQSVEDMQKLGQAQMENASMSVNVFSKSFQTLATETANYSKQSMEASSRFVEKLFSVKSVDGAVELQTEYARQAYEAFVTQATRVGGILSTMTKEAFKPMEDAYAKAQAAAK